MSRRLRLLAIALLATTAVFASAAAAEMPSNRESPTITGDTAPVVGQSLLGNNGTWLYDDGSACRDECRYSFAWYRCSPGSACAPIPGARERKYVVGTSDVGRSLRVAVTATKNDCDAHGRNCRDVTRTAISGETPPVSPQPPSPVQLTIAGVTVLPAAKGRLSVVLRITDEKGMAVRGGLVTVRAGAAASSGRIQGDGTAQVVLRRPLRTSVTLAIRADRPRDGNSRPANLALRVPLPG